MTGVQTCALPISAVLGVVGVHEQHGLGHGAVQLGHAARHAAGVPVLQHAAGAQPQVKVLVRALCGRLVGQGKDVGLAICIAVKADARSLGNVGIVALAKTPQRLLAIDNRPSPSILSSGKPALISTCTLLSAGAISTRRLRSRFVRVPARSSLR